MWFNPKLTETPALKRIIRSNRNKLEIEMAELAIDIMQQMNIKEYSFCLNDIVSLLNFTQVKAEKGQVRKVVQDIWKLQPASNTFCYTTYQIDYNRPNYYSDVRRMGRYYTVTLKQLLAL